MREHVTTLLDVLGVLLLAAGAALAAAPYLGGAAVAEIGRAHV